MFGYIRPDEPYLYKKDETLYNACYCGLCFAIKELCGQTARFTLTYDVAFLSVLLHNLADKDVKIEKKRCIAHAVKKRNVALSDDIFASCAALNVILAYYKILDDIDDENKGGIKKLFFNGAYKKATEKHPELDKIVRKCYVDLAKKEKDKCSSPDIVADCFAELSRKAAKYVVKDKYTDEIGNTFYFLGKWIYLIDALDDIDKDKKGGEYNVFVTSYPECGCGKDMINLHREEIFGIFNSVFYHLTDSLSKVKFYFNKDLIENVLVRGIPSVTDKIIKKYLSQECKNCGQGVK